MSEALEIPRALVPVVSKRESQILESYDLSKHWARLHPRLLKASKRLCDSRTQVEDVFHCAFTNAVRYLTRRGSPKVTSETGIVAWLRMIARRCAIRHLAQRKKHDHEQLTGTEAVPKRSEDLDFLKEVFELKGNRVLHKNPEVQLGKLLTYCIGADVFFDISSSPAPRAKRNQSEASLEDLTSSQVGDEEEGRKPTGERPRRELKASLVAKQFGISERVARECVREALEIVRSLFDRDR